MKIERLLGIVIYLLQKERATAPELAERFEVSRRTINRDIEELCRAGIPLVTIQGCRGGVSIAEGCKIDRRFFSEEEMEATLAGLRGMDSVSKTSCLKGVLEKLSTRENPVAAGEIFLIDLSFHGQAALTRKVEVIKGAIKDRRRIAFTYFYRKGECRRTIEPYWLVFRWFAWYVWGYCLERGAFRLFKLNRLWEAEALDETFPPREMPPLGPELDRCFAAGEFRLKALFEEGEKYRIIEEYGVDSYRVEEDGRLLLERDFAGYENMREWVLSFGDKVEVLEPGRLREDLCRQAKNILKRLEEHDG